MTSAAFLISFGALLGKLNPFQTLIMALIESTIFVANAYLGYKVLGTLDIGTHCSKSSFFVKKFNFDCSRKIVVELFLVKMLRLWTFLAVTTSISREKLSKKFGWKTRWNCWRFSIFSCWQLWFPEKIVKYC